ncbi:LOW QUALITY PROTEIN: transferrin 2-like [Tachypleus tridentatus]|uniref:LOW QUALITY PROTEIN: transferrin 2-like n=1 Tax=Tachypleus tridentatus TaxID=6853 RepID=UPI003FD1657A
MVEIEKQIIRFIFRFFIFYVHVGGSVEGETISWCTISHVEFQKCEDFANAIRNSYEFDVELECKRGEDKNLCMNMIDGGRANLMTLDAGEVYVAGRYHSLVPILSERYGPEKKSGFYAVAVIHAHSMIKSLEDLRDKKACFTGVGQMAGWIIPMATLIETEVLAITDCNNIIKTAAEFFNDSCAPNSLIDKYNPTGDNPQKMCNLCATQKGDRCSGSDPYVEFGGAFSCFLNNGDVTFLKHTTIEEELAKPQYQQLSTSQFRLLCPNGGTRSIRDYRFCNWGFITSHAVVTSSAALPQTREMYQQFLMKAASMFSGNQNRYSVTNATVPSIMGSDTFGPISEFKDETFHLFGRSKIYDYVGNLMFQDETSDLAPVEGNRQTFTGYLADHEKYIASLRKCPVPAAKLCVVSDKEMEKCHKMKTAFRAQMLKPDLTCVKAHSHISCMSMINQGYADLTVLDAGDIYTAGHKYNLIPIVAEQYNLDDTYYYVVAVAQQPDKETDLLYLKGKRSCHTGIGMAAGWVVPLSFLLTNERMRSFGCNSAHAAAEFFQKSCVPGALSREYTGGFWSYDNLCDLCHGSSFGFCSRDSLEPFYGHTGAFRCLVEGGGEVAFVKHTTIVENTAGRNPQWWSRNVMPDDFELLCRDGSRAGYDEYEECNLGKVSANAIVTSADKPEDIIEAYVRLFLYGQQFYGSKYSEEFTFKMFVSELGHSDLIFQDATQQLKEIPIDQRDIDLYLGNDFVQSMKIVDCTAGSSSTVSNLWMYFLAILSLLFCT